jgi:hypothetical protein
MAAAAACGISGGERWPRAFHSSLPGFHMDHRIRQRLFRSLAGRSRPVMTMEDRARQP